jgi:beta-glucosidase
MAAIVFAGLPGMEGGQAVADILFGDANPSGKLPFSYPKHTGSIVPYDHKPLEEADGNRYDPQFPFGHGLSYTAFETRDLKIDRAKMKRGETLGVSVTVANVGSRAGQEVVALYLTDVYGQVSRPVRQLKKFAKIALEPGKEELVRFALTDDDLSFIGLENRRIVEPGLFKVTVGSMTKDFVLE